MKINTKLLLFCIVSSFPLIGMENKDVWTVIVATSPEKNIFREVCKGLQAISHKNNPELYLCKNLVLTQWQQAYAFELATYKRWPQAFKNLLDLGFEYDEKASALCISLSVLAQYNDPFICACELNHHTHPKYLLASFFGDLDYLQDYCKNPSNQLTQTFPSSNANALHSAIHGCHTATSIFIINKSPDLIDKPTKKHATPLYKACGQGMITVVELLLSKKVSTKYLFDNFYSCLHMATEYGRTNIVELLLAHDPSLINLVAKDNWTALHVASWQDYTDVAQLLLNTPGIEVNIINKYPHQNLDDKTPLDWAYGNESQEMIDLLRQHGAQTCAEIEYAKQQEQDKQSTDNCSVM